MQRRYDLVPNLVTTVQGCMRHESGVLERVCHLRSKPDMAVGQRAGEESGLSRSISRLFALAEAYPDLKASEGFRQLHGSLVRIETSRAPAPEQGLTVALSWPKGWVAEPPIRQKTPLVPVRQRRRDRPASGPSRATGLVPVGWNKVGRDPDRGVIIPRFEPPAGLSAAACSCAR